MKGELVTLEKMTYRMEVLDWPQEMLGSSFGIQAKCPLNLLPFSLLILRKGKYIFLNHGFHASVKFNCHHVSFVGGFLREPSFPIPLLHLPSCCQAGESHKKIKDTSPVFGKHILVMEINM